MLNDKDDHAGALFYLVLEAGFGNLEYEVTIGNDFHRIRLEVAGGWRTFRGLESGGNYGEGNWFW